MTTGTKIFLAVLGIVLGGLVLYYTVITGSDVEPLMVDSTVQDRTKAAANGRPLDPTAPGNSAPPAVAPRTTKKTVTPARTASRSPGRPNGRASNRTQQSSSPLTESVARALDQPGAGGTASRQSAARTRGPVTRQPAAARTSRGKVAANTGVDANGSPAASTNRSRRGKTPAVRTNQPQRAGRHGSSRRAAATTDYHVQPNDTLSSIAHSYYGDARRWDIIAQANPRVNPKRLRPGQLLQLPPKPAARSTGSSRHARSQSSRPTAESYIVRTGDTLSEIASTVYGSSADWRRIYEANRSLIGPDPHRLKVGMRLRIPTARG